MFYVYCLENIESDKKYFGYTSLKPTGISFNTLFKLASNNKDLIHLYHSMKKYGEEAFCVSIYGLYSEEENALNCMKRLTQINETYYSSKGYNYKDAQLIPVQGVEAPQEPYSLFDVITVRTKNLSDMKDYYVNGEFTDFMIAYDAFNRYIPITGELKNFCLAKSAIMMQLLDVCKDALSVYIKEHKML